MKKIAVIWGSHRKDAPFSTHHSFWEATIREYPGMRMERVTWDEVKHLPDGFDLYFFIDFHPSLFRLPPDRLRPRAFYWWDSFHHTFVYPAQVASLFDRSYFAEKITTDGLRALGVANAQWLPGAFYPGLYHPLPGMNKVHDYGFIGNEDDVMVRARLTRKGFLDRLRYTSGLHGYLGHGVTGPIVNQIYNESKILFDWSIWNNVGTRIFEAIGSGGFFLTNRSPHPSGLAELAEDGKHFVSYDGSFDDFERQFRKYLADEGARIRIARDGHAHFLKHHTYERRLEVILKDFELA